MWCKAKDASIFLGAVRILATLRFPLWWSVDVCGIFFLVCGWVVGGDDAFGTYSFPFLCVTTFCRTNEIRERSYYAINLHHTTFLISDMMYPLFQCVLHSFTMCKHRGQLGLPWKYYIHGTKREEPTLLSSKLNSSCELLLCFSYFQHPIQYVELPNNDSSAVPGIWFTHCLCKHVK